MQEFASAEENIKNYLNYSPYDPNAHYELALVYLESGNRIKAKEHLVIATDIWKDADPGIKIIDDARERVAELKHQ
jgi:DNA-binding SARP family transcriptional activator